MRRVVLSLALVAGLAAVAPSLAAEEAKPAAPAPAADAPEKGGMDDPDRIVCTREHVVGSNRKQKVCMTVAERQRLKDAADRALGKSRPTTGGMPEPM